MVVTRPRFRALTAGLLASLASLCSAQGLLGADSTWPRWQARFAVGTAADSALVAPGASFWASATEARIRSASLYGDYYFHLPSLVSPSVLGGFRATSGVLFGSAGRGLGASALPGASGNGFSLGRVPLSTALDSVDGPESDSPLPYVGLGYTRLSVSGRWGFSADVGMVSQNPGAAPRLGSALFAPQNLDDAVRNLRLTPLVHVDVRYSF